MRGKILIVDDHTDCRKILAFQARDIGYEVVEAEGGASGIEKAAAEMPDLIVMDLRMPGLNGMEATRRLKSNPLTKHIPIVVFTAWGADNWRKEALAAGATMVLTKPDSYSVLRDLLQQFQ